MKSKHYVTVLFVLLAAAIIASATIIYRQANEPAILQHIDEVIYTDIVLENQPFYAKFGSLIQQQSLENGAIQLLDKDGQNVVFDGEIIEDRLLAIPELPIGEYQLTIAADTLVEPMSYEQVLDFVVYEQSEQVKSEEELYRYFRASQQSREARNLNDYARHNFFNEAEMMSEDSSATSSAEPYATTNNQVEGIEEGDIVITDGDMIYSIQDNKVFLTQASPLSVKGSLTMPNAYPTKLMKYKDYLLVFYEHYNEESYYGTMLTNVNIYHVADPANPQLVREIGQEGYPIGMRLMNGTLYIATEKQQYVEGKQQGDLRPAMTDSAQKDAQFVDYEDIQIFPDTQSESYTVISAMALDSPAESPFETYAFIGSGGDFYMSNGAIYLASPHSQIIPFMSPRAMDMAISIPWGPPAKTTVYKYELAGTKITRKAEAVVEGGVLNQFSMDEHNGYFRIATTTGNASLREADANNHLTILDENLQEVGKLTDLARGERIYSVRYMGDKAYMVTFKETDPLFVIDVADPRNPHVLGELKIPGFSNYLHPISETHLIGIGHDTEVKAKDGVVLTKGIKVSLFDVGDVNRPVEVDSDVIGGQGTYSEVTNNHKAFYRDQENNYYGFPISVYDEHVYNGTGAVVYEITEQGIDLRGELLEKNQNDQYEEWDDVISRLIYSGDKLYSIHNKKIKAYDRKTLQPVGEVIMP